MGLCHHIYFGKFYHTFGRLRSKSIPACTTDRQRKHPDNFKFVKQIDAPIDMEQ